MRPNDFSAILRIQLFWLSYWVSIKNRLLNALSLKPESTESPGQGYALTPSSYYQLEAKSLFEARTIRPEQFGEAAIRDNARRTLRRLLKIKSRKRKIIRGSELLKKKEFAIERIYVSFGLNQDCPIDMITSSDFEGKEKPLMICMQGYNSGAHLSLGRVIEPYDVYKVASGSSIALDAARLGFRVLSYERPCFGERRETKLQKPIPNPTVDASFSALMVGETLLGQTVSEISSLIDWADQQFNCVELGTYISGYSAAGTTAIFASAVDERIDGIAVGGCIGKFQETVMKRGTGGYVAIPDLLEFFECDSLLALVAPRILVAISGVDDHIFPFSGAEKCFESAKSAFWSEGAEAAILHLKGERGHTYYPEQLWPAFVNVINLRSGTTGKSI